MVVASPTQLPVPNEKIQAVVHDHLPIIDLSSSKKKRSEVSKLIVKACEEYGFFKVINHGVPENIITRMEEESFKFFEKPVSEKQHAGPANPFGYGCKNIGFNGDVGDVEYLLLNTNPISISQRSQTISNDPDSFSSVVSCYIEAVRRMACEILELVAEGLWVTDKSVFSKLIIDNDSDSLLRLNHYPPLPLLQPQENCCKDKGVEEDNRSSPPPPPPPVMMMPHHQFQNHHNNININNSNCNCNCTNKSSRIGFGEHSDPQILTILRSNDVCGLQISPQVGVWVPVSPDPTAFCVNVGDVLQAMTNGRFVSVRHRAMTNSHKSRLSMAYFGAPPLHAWITPPPELLTPNMPSLFKPFTWADYKKAAFSLRLGESRLDLFRACEEDDSSPR